MVEDSEEGGDGADSDVRRWMPVEAEHMPVEAEFEEEDADEEVRGGWR
jgi:hypothetical protein